MRPDGDLVVTVTIGELRELMREVLRDELAEDESDLSPYMSTTEVAERYDVSRRTVLNWCKTGKVAAVQAGSQWRIRRDSLPDAA